MILLVSCRNDERTGFQVWRHAVETHVQVYFHTKIIEKILGPGALLCFAGLATLQSCSPNPTEVSSPSTKTAPHRPHPHPHLIQPLVQLLIPTLPQPHLSSRPRKTLLALATRGDGPRLVPLRTRPLASRALITVQAGLQRPASGPRRSSRYSMGGRSPRSIEQWEMLARVK
jgi:hypothetical protein